MLPTDVEVRRFLESGDYKRFMPEILSSTTQREAIRTFRIPEKGLVAINYLLGRSLMSYTMPEGDLAKAGLSLAEVAESIEQVMATDVSDEDKEDRIASMMSSWESQWKSEFFDKELRAEWKRRLDVYEKTARKSLRAWLRRELVRTIDDRYDEWKKYRSQGISAREPQLTATDLQGEIRMYREGDNATEDAVDLWNKLDRKQRSTIVWSMLEALRKKGEIGSSIGPGLYGKETRFYEPA